MSTYEINSNSLLELMKQKAPNGDALTVAEILTEQNEIMQDAVWVQANGDTIHKVNYRTKLPKGTHRRLNEGVLASASQTADRVVGLASYYSRSVVDVDLVKIAPDATRFRMNEAKAHIEGMGQTWAQELIYGNKTDNVESFNGLANLLGSLKDGNNVSIPTIIDAGGTGSNLTSIYAVVWGDNQAFCAYPKNTSTPGSVEHTDVGMVSVEDENKPGGKYLAYEDYFSMKGGFCHVNPRAIGRICNINPTATFDEDLLIDLLNNMDIGAGTPFLYLNRTMFGQIQKRVNDKANVNYSPVEVWGRPQTSFLTVPLRRTDAILNTENQVQ